MDSTNKCMKVLEEYCEVSGIHGFQFLKGGWSIIERVLWFAILIVSFIFSGILLQQMFANWEENPLEITIDTTALPIQLLPFPMVTVCSPNYDNMGFIQR